MTDIDFPPCGLCNANPDIGHITGLVFHPVNDCPSFSAHAFTPEQWRQLHGSAQVLKQIKTELDGYTETGFEEFLVRAQQLSGSE